MPHRHYQGRLRYQHTAFFELAVTGKGATAKNES
jgi:hypothetical protein